MKKKVLITGVSGLVGHGLAKYFLKKKYIVFGTTYKNSVKTDLKKLKRVSNFDITKKNSYKRLTKIIKKIDYVIHVAAKIPAKEKKNYNFTKINYQGTKLLLDFCLKNNIKKFIFISTMSLANKKKFVKNNYLYSKIKAEKYCYKINKKKLIKISILRIKAPYGFLSSNAVIPFFIKQMKQGKNLYLFSNGIRKQIFTFVSDIAKATEILFYKKNLLNSLLGPEVVTMKYLARLVLKIFRKNKKQKIIYLKKKEKNLIQNFKFKNSNIFKFKKITLLQGLRIIKNYS